MKVPAGWTVENIGSQIDLISGQHVEAQYCNDFGEGIPYLTGPSDFEGYKITPTKYTTLPTKFCQPGDILITVKGSGTGRIAISDNIYCISRQLMAIRGHTAHQNFLFQALIPLQSKFSEAANGLIPGIARSDITGLNILLPPLPEQHEIATILSTWDDSLSTLARLSDTKRQQKRALAEQLLTGKRRLKGFEGEWAVLVMGDLFEERREQGNIDLPLLSITRDRGIIPRNELEKKDTSNEDKSKYLKICINDIGYNTMRMWQGVSALSEIEGIVSPAYTICIPKKAIDPSFAACMLKSESLISLFERHSQGLTSDTWNLKFSIFKKIPVFIPKDIAEQQAISAVLLALDTEIDLLVRQHAKVQEQKRGLMDLLLTGKVRVQVPEEVPA
ncbi:restriction endonuclease subunit S [Deinococcus altitudinis]|uniref:restriction endonuclease subunit S n=1 Tax=Deinococcus altitudinis TaxID=468914 RepID=UPI00389297DD